MPSLLSKNSLTAMARIPSCAKRSPKMIWVWLLFGNELPPLHRLKEALLVLINMEGPVLLEMLRDRKSTRLNSSHGYISYAVFCLKKKKKTTITRIKHQTLSVHKTFTHDGTYSV